MNSLLSRVPRIRPRMLKLLMAACGVLGLIFRLLITVTAIDDKGLMTPWNPAWICLWLVTIAAAAILAAGVLPIKGPAAYRAAFPHSLAGAGAGVLAAVCALAAAYDHFLSGGSGLVFFLQCGLMVLAALAFLLAAGCRLFGRQPLFLFHVAVCLWFALRMLTLYQTWSFDPQLQDYCFQLFACIALTMTAYQLAAFDMDRRSHRKLWAWGLASVYLCCLAATDSLFFISGGLWAFANLSNLRRPRQRREAEDPANIE